MVGGFLFAIGALGLLSFAVFLYLESRRTVRYGKDLRARLDGVVVRMYRTLVFGEIPHTYRDHAAEFLRRQFQRSVSFLVGSLRAVERPLSRLNNRMRRTSGNEKQSAPSPYLETIRPQKRDTPHTE